MTITEFQAWLEGFEEAVDGAPTPEQWAKVKEKIAILQALRFDMPSPWNVPSIPYPKPSPYMPVITRPGTGLPILDPFVTTCGTPNQTSSMGH